MTNEIIQIVLKRKSYANKELLLVFCLFQICIIDAKAKYKIVLLNW